MTSITSNSESSTNIQKNNRIFTISLVGAIILPWPNGGEVVWQYLLFSIGIFSIASIYSFKNKDYENSQFYSLQIIKKPLILLGMWMVFQILQIAPIPIHLPELSYQNLAPTKWNTISIAPNVTVIEVLKHASFIVFFILILLLLDTKERVVRLSKALFIMSAIIALYSIINHYTKGAFSIVSSIPPWTISWEQATHGTFSYQNHYASFLTITIPLGYGLLYANLKSTASKGVNKSNLDKALHVLFSINGIYLLSLVIMIIALFKTASRGGNAAFIISITITFFSVVLQQKGSKKTKVRQSLLIAIGVVLFAVAVIYTGLANSLIKRLDTHGYNTNGRILMSQAAFEIFKQRPLIGTGAGTYPILQHRYKSPLLGHSAMSKRAHNDYLELLANQGIIGFGLLGSATCLLLLVLFQGLKRSASNTGGNLYGFMVASFCSVIAILFHSVVDFNFHLPANTVYFYLVLALGIKSQLIDQTKATSSMKV